jgi:hypothetical protein
MIKHILTSLMCNGFNETSGLRTESFLYRIHPEILKGAFRAVSLLTVHNASMF